MERRTDIDISDISIIVKKTDPDGLLFTCRSRAEDGFVYFLDGEGTLTDARGEVYPIHAGSIAFFARGDRYTFVLPGTCTYITSAYRISRDEGGTLAACPRVTVADEERAALLLRIEREWQLHRSLSFMATKLDILSLYLWVLAQKEPSFTTGDTAVDLVIEFIRQNFRRNFTAAELSAHCHLSVSHLRTKLRAATGLGVTEYRDALRMRSAEEMLRSGLFSVKEIAYHLGYADVYHFTKVFRAKTGIPPGRYARMESNKLPTGH